MRLGKAFEKAFLVGDCQTCFRFLSQTFAFSESGFLPLHTCLFREPHFRKTCIFRETKSVIVVKVFSASCVGFNEICFVYYGKCSQLTQNETSDTHENLVFCEYHLGQSLFKCTRQRKLS